MADQTFVVFDKRVKRMGKPFQKEPIPVTYDFPAILESLSSEHKDLIVKNIINDYIKSNYDSLTAAYVETQGYIEVVKRMGKRFGKVDWTDAELQEQVSEYVNDLNSDSLKQLSDEDKANFQPLRAQFEPFTKFVFTGGHIVEWASNPDTLFKAPADGSSPFVEPVITGEVPATNGETPAETPASDSIESGQTGRRRRG